MLETRRNGVEAAAIREDERAVGVSVQPSCRRRREKARGGPTEADGGDRLDQVMEEAAALQAASPLGTEQPLGRAQSLLGGVAEAELALGHGRAEAACAS